MSAEPGARKGESSNVVRLQHYASRAVLRPCLARVEGPFLATDATELRCGGEKGHEGAHFFHVEWTVRDDG